MELPKGLNKMSYEECDKWKQANMAEKKKNKLIAMKVNEQWEKMYIEKLMADKIAAMSDPEKVAMAQALKVSGIKSEEKGMGTH